MPSILNGKRPEKYSNKECTCKMVLNTEYKLTNHFQPYQFNGELDSLLKSICESIIVYLLDLIQ